MGYFVVAEFLLTSASCSPSAIAEPLVSFVTSSSAVAEGPRDALVSRNSATTKYRYRVALFA